MIKEEKEILAILRPKGWYIMVYGYRGCNVFMTAFENPALYNAELHSYCIQVEKCFYRLLSFGVFNTKLCPYLQGRLGHLQASVAMTFGV
jgi:hypothetical protein